MNGTKLQNCPNSNNPLTRINAWGTTVGTYLEWDDAKEVHVERIEVSDEQSYYCARCGEEITCWDGELEDLLEGALWAKDGDGRLNL